VSPSSKNESKLAELELEKCHMGTGMALKSVFGRTKRVSHTWDVSVQLEMHFKAIPHVFPYRNAPGTALDVMSLAT
jgi:hypothetical protein